ncbi:MAG: hypothetical protein Q8902_14735 [Bacteroidota bacterium]|nr:hypothetical protein [Bacteroidota bacterium]
MIEYKQGAYREFNLETIFSDEVQVPDNKIIWRSRHLLADGRPDPENEELIQIAQNGINVVSSRDVRRNVRTSLRIGLDLAASGLRVLYVNSYAGVALLRESLQSELNAGGSRVNHPLIVGDDPALKRRGNLIDERRGNLTDEGRVDYLKSNFRILDCKMGTWGVCAGVVRNMLSTTRRVDGVDHREAKIDVLILNSFEFSGLYYYEKRWVALDVNDWVNEISLTAIVFTQEVRAVMGAGIPVRGPVGLLTAWAMTVSKVDEPLVGRNSPVHEKLPKINNKKIYTDAVPLEISGCEDEQGEDDPDEPTPYGGPYDEEGRPLRYEWEGKLSPEYPQPPEWPGGITNDERGMGCRKP